jgi:peptide/nickel transport system ATP-binding protein
VEELLKITDLSVEYRVGGAVAKAVNNLTLAIEKSSALGLVGESGAGKTTAALSILGLLPEAVAHMTSGNIEFHGKSIVGLPEKEHTEILGQKIAMVFSNPLSSLNPLFTVGHQISMVLRKHRNISEQEARKETAEMLRLVGIPEYRMNDYPFQFSGGMRQRVGIAAALICSPELLIADEPTTALDVTIQAQIMELLKKLQREYSSSLLMITHNLGIISELCQKVAVMYSGQIVEHGTVGEVFTDPRHMYTQGLIRAIPKLAGERERLESIPGNVTNAEMLPDGCKFHPRCRNCSDKCRTEIPPMTKLSDSHYVMCWNHSMEPHETVAETQNAGNAAEWDKPGPANGCQPVHAGAKRPNPNVAGSSLEKPLIRIKNLKKYFKISEKGMLHAVDDITCDIMPNETLGLVGESGCGKSTVGNVIMGLLPPTGGEIFCGEKNILSAVGRERRELTKRLQMIFQDPYSSLNPRKTVRTLLSQIYEINNVTRDKKELARLVNQLAERVGLESYLMNKYPHELDGGKRQMVGIARALAMNPQFIVCDEPVSALDVSVQATILNILIDMQREMGLAYLFISHDLSVVRHISNRIAVMYLGQIVELAPTDEIFSNTLHPYSVALLSAVPKISFQERSDRIVLTGDVPSPLNPKPGCRFAPRCWKATEACRTQDPSLREVSTGHYVSCHL